MWKYYAKFVYDTQKETVNKGTDRLTAFIQMRKIRIILRFVRSALFLYSPSKNLRITSFQQQSRFHCDNRRLTCRRQNKPQGQNFPPVYNMMKGKIQ